MRAASPPAGFIALGRPWALWLSFVVAVFVVAGCRGSAARREHGILEDDPHSFARPREAVVTALDLSLEVDFAARELRGVATWSIERREDGDVLVLDTDGLAIDSVATVDSAGQALEVEFALGPQEAVRGRALTVPIAPDTTRVRIAYRTAPSGDAGALMWVAPEQTTSGRHPFLFTQSQPIYARSWFPCQDSPGVRFSYRATIRVPRGLTAVMSAERVPTSDVASQGDVDFFAFRSDEPIPSYLVALAVGELEFRAIGERCGVYAEPAMVERAAWEFGEAEAMLEFAEARWGAFRWDRYDILVLPPSFPFGGMENPRVTFVTPTIVAGDRSLVALIAHELGHSWAGNLVTNATWDGIWLNEGFTVYLEHRIMEHLRGSDYDDMLVALGVRELEEDLAHGRPEDTHLELDLAGRDPDGGMTSVAYDKGYLFLRMIESEVGRRRWDAFLTEYFERFAFASMTSERFVEFLRAELIGADAALDARLRVDAWINGPGLPANAPRIESAAFLRVAVEAKRWAGGLEDATDLDTDGWSAHEWVEFLRALRAVGDESGGSLPAERLAALEGAFNLSASGNAEVLFEWFLLAIRGGHDVRPALESFLMRVGRRKFLTPLYTALMASAEDTRSWARAVYARARPGYHELATSALDPLLAR